MNIIDMAKLIKDDEANAILSHPEDYDRDMIDWAKSRE